MASSTTHDKEIGQSNLSSPWLKSRGSRCERRGPGCKARRSRRCQVIVEEALHRRRVHAAATRRAPGVCGRWAALLVIDDVQASTPPRALPATADPWRATPRDFNHGLLALWVAGATALFLCCSSSPMSSNPMASYLWDRTLVFGKYDDVCGECEGVEFAKRRRRDARHREGGATKKLGPVCARHKMARTAD